MEKYNILNSLKILEEELETKHSKKQIEVNIRSLQKRLKILNEKQDLYIDKINKKNNLINKSLKSSINIKQII